MLFVWLLVSVATAGATVTGAAGAATPEPTSALAEPQLVEVYPNTAIEGNAGEYVVIEVPEATSLAGWTLADGETTTPLTTANVSGRVAFSREPALTREIVEYSVLSLPERFEMAQSGETIRLRHEDRVVDETTYDRAPESERWLRTDEGWEWRPRGATAFEAEDLPAEGATAFVLPDSPDVPLETLRGADERIWLAGYTFSSEPAAAELDAAAERGVDVRVLVDGAPVGGQTAAEAATLDALVENGVPVQVFDGSPSRYRFHHAKYAVVDDRVLVLTENWKPSGTGGRSSRGWGVAIEGEAVAADLAAVFEADAGWEDTVEWERYREGRTFVADDRAEGSYPTRFEPGSASVESVRVVTAPDNANEEVVALLDSAEESIRIEQVTIGDRDHSFLQAAIAAAKRGVEVEILLDDSWYTAEDNRRLVEWLNARAAANDLPLEARLVDPRGNFEKIHAKGIVVDERRTLIGSINWTNNSVQDNREVAVIVESKAVGEYYAEVFDADWGGGGQSIPVGVALGVVAAGGGAALVGRRLIAFD